MRNLKFKYFSAKNFICFGPEGIEIDLTKRGNVILIRGENLDVMDEEECTASNGIGKSSIATILIYTLFGNTVNYHKKLKHENVINNQMGKDLRTEVRWDKYRVVRTRNPSNLRFWESEEGVWNKDTELTLGGMLDTQKLIDNTLGLNYETCLNLLIFADQNHCSFLECDSPHKRAIVEDLMSLQVYRQYLEQAKEEKNSLRSQVKILSADYERSLAESKAAQDRVDQIKREELSWYAARKKELIVLEQKLSEKKTKIKISDIGEELAKYESAQSTIQELNEQIIKGEQRLVKIREALQLYEEKTESRKQEKNDLNQKILKLQNQNVPLIQDVKDKEKILKVKDKKDQRCSECYGVVSEKNYSVFVSNAEKSISENKSIITANNTEIQQLKIQKEEIESKIVKGVQGTTHRRLEEKETSSLLDNARKNINKLSAIQKPVANDQEKVLLSEIAEVEKQIVVKNEEINGQSPYISLLETSQKDIEDKTKECQTKKLKLDTTEADLPYYEWWTDGFSTKGIPKFAINDIIPALNTQVAHWLEVLIDGKIKLSFDNELSETIERNPSDGDPFVYYAMSGGERRRLNLAVSQAFAYIMAHSSKTSPSLVFLDEVTTNIDQMGVVGVYNMILELAKDKQVFVTTHDQGLLELLQGCETIYLRKKGGFSKIVN